jgi:hypothetical protein
MTTRKATIALPGLGKLTVKDAKKAVTVTLGAAHCQHGAKSDPAHCAIAQAGQAMYQGFEAEGGMFRGIYILKSTAYAVVEVKRELIARRYLFPSDIRHKINGFDASSAGALQPGDVVTFCPPRGQKRLGHNIHAKNPVVRVAGQPTKRRGYVRGSLKDKRLHELVAAGLRAQNNPDVSFTGATDGR